jgi:hypothetical protein
MEVYEIKLKNSIKLIFVLLINLFAKVSFSQDIDTIYVAYRCIYIKCEERISKICFDNKKLTFIDENNTKEFNLENFSKTIADSISFCTFKSEIMFLKRDNLIILLFTDFIEKNRGVLRLIYYEDRKEIKLQFMKNQQLFFVTGGV